MQALAKHAIQGTATKEISPICVVISIKSLLPYAKSKQIEVNTNNNVAESAHGQIMPTFEPMIR